MDLICLFFLALANAQQTAQKFIQETRYLLYLPDGYERDTGEAWSVVVKGHAEEIARGHDLFDTVGLPLFPWHAAPKQRFVRIVPDEVSGRRFHVIDREAWRTHWMDAPTSATE